MSGVVGVAFGLDGINDQIQVPNSPLLSFAPGSFMTIELWALRASPAGVMHLCGKRAGCGAINYQMAIDAGTPASAIPLNTWLHWAQVYDQAGLTVYTNGAVLTLIPGARVGSQNADPFHIGTSGTCGGYWGGRIDEASIYNRALTVAEIRSIYLAGPAGKCKRFRILVSPEDQVIACGSNAMFSVVATNELGDLTYQWQFNGTNIADATARTLTLTNTTTGQAGIYTVIISNALGQCLSASAYLWFSFLDLHMYAGVTIRGSVGSGHRVEYAENLEPPIQWMSLTNIASLPFSPFIYIDYESAGKPKRFYRVVSDACP